MRRLRGGVLLLWLGLLLAALTHTHKARAVRFGGLVKRASAATAAGSSSSSSPSDGRKRAAEEVGKRRAGDFNAWTQVRMRARKCRTSRQCVSWTVTVHQRPLSPVRVPPYQLTPADQGRDRDALGPGHRADVQRQHRQAAARQGRDRGVQRFAHATDASILEQGRRHLPRLQAVAGTAGTEWERRTGEGRG